MKRKSISCYCNSSCLLFILLLCGCTPNHSDKEMLIDVDILMAMSVGEVIPFVRIADFSKGYICILYPYQSAVSLKYPEADKINAYIKQINLRVDESHWSIVFFNGTQVQVDTLRRLKQMDIIGGHELRNQSHLVLPRSFEITDCASVNEAAFYKLKINNRDYLLFGRIK